MININFYSNGFANHIVRKAKTKKTNTSLRDPFCNLFMKTSCWQYNRSPIDKAYTIKMTEYLPHLFSIFAFYTFLLNYPWFCLSTKKWRKLNSITWLLCCHLDYLTFFRNAYELIYFNKNYCYLSFITKNKIKL